LKRWLCPLCNSLFIKIENVITIKLHCQLFSDSEPLDDNTQSILSAHLPSRPEDLGWPARGRADAIIMINDRVTNLGGKSLSKLIHCFLIMLIKALSFSVNMLYFVKVQSMYVPKVFTMKSNLLHIFDLIKLYAIR